MVPDETLFQRVRAGDIAAFDTLYERYEGRLFAYLRAVTGNRQDAEELLHDAFLAALKTEQAAFDEGAFRGFLYRVARNLAFNRRRSAQRRDRMLASVPVEAAEEAGADSALERRELELALDEAVARLPEGLGELYHLRSSGLSYEQIATVIEAPLGTVKSRMHQMVNVLREELKPWIVKYTVSLFKTPSGRTFEGTGLAPDVEVAMDDKDLARANAAKPADRLALDVQLRTAKELLLRR